jgi:hypothetical protein
VGRHQRRRQLALIRQLEVDDQEVEFGRAGWFWRRWRPPRSEQGRVLFVKRDREFGSYPADELGVPRSAIDQCRRSDDDAEERVTPVPRPDGAPHAHRQVAGEAPSLAPRCRQQLMPAQAVELEHEAQARFRGSVDDRRGRRRQTHYCVAAGSDGGKVSRNFLDRPFA